MNDGGRLRFAPAAVFYREFNHRLYALKLFFSTPWRQTFRCSLSVTVPLLTKYRHLTSSHNAWVDSNWQASHQTNKLQTRDLFVCLNKVNCLFVWFDQTGQLFGLV
jgi:uncharacterized membrane protein